MKKQVTFRTRTGHEIVETFNMEPHSNGFVPDIKLRALALGWSIVKIEEISK